MKTVIDKVKLEKSVDSLECDVIDLVNNIRERGRQ